MDVRENLMELIKDGIRKGLRAMGDERLDYSFEDVADHLISSGVTLQEWISVNDRLPEDDLPKGTKKKMIRCLVYTNKGTVKPCVRQRWEVNGKLVPWQWNKDLFANPTHWMYYPQPPKGE